MGEELADVGGEWGEWMTEGVPNRGRAGVSGSQMEKHQESDKEYCTKF